MISEMEKLGNLLFEEMLHENCTPFIFSVILCENVKNILHEDALGSSAKAYII